MSHDSFGRTALVRVRFYLLGREENNFQNGQFHETFETIIIQCARKYTSTSSTVEERTFNKGKQFKRKRGEGWAEIQNRKRL